MAGSDKGRDVRIGSVTGGAVGIGDHNTVSVTNNQGVAGDPAQAELLAAVQTLRADLARFVASDRTAGLDAELVAAEEEIAASGAASPGRLARLRDALAVAGTTVATLASGVAVAESVTALLGG
ncbi:hypothetical protein [Streptomyces corynorhini]|uniref:Uncharacterized protein n=1 Tax=Streptomyces corynorhini TaxID=2282652 RepID=A0A370B8R6_9ACTN|nr:hypothetical protein [Streptomyces corynorhini]RDG35805.1 hypothetical protein DVH02_23365 [Streptomyces corynorhini]